MKVIIFDFDGVIVNSLDFSFEINKKYNPSITREDWVEFHNGNGFYEEFNKPGAVIKNTLEEFYNEYVKKIYSQRPYEGMPKALKALSKKYKLVIVSGSDEEIIKKYLKKHKLEYFEIVLGLRSHLDKTHKLLKTLELFDATKDDAIFITDTICDLNESKAVNVPAIGVSWGMFNSERLLKAGALNVVETPKTLVAEIENYFKK